MPTVDRIWKVGGVNPLNPAIIASTVTEPDEWFGKCNGVSCPRGRQYGEADFLVPYEFMLSVVGQNSVNIECKYESGAGTTTSTWLEYYVTKATAVTPGGKSGSPGPAYWVTLADRRWLLEKVALNRRFNLRKDESNWVDSSINAGTPYTWQEVLKEMWDLLPATAGACPGLPINPISTPENFVFDGFNCWRAIHQVLAALGCDSVLDPFTGIFKFVDLKATQGGLAALKQTNSNRRLWDFGPRELPKNNFPEKVVVTFHKIPGTDTTDAPFPIKPETEELDVEQGYPGTKWPVVDTMFATASNGFDRFVRAGEIADALKGLFKPAAKPWGAVYAGIVLFVPGEELTGVTWVSDGTRGMQTIPIYTFKTWEWPELITDGGGAGGGHEIRFRVVNCVCTGGTLDYIEVEWTHYSGGCDDPPGVDPYTGYIHVYDTCVLSYYTVDFLSSGTATGRATYFYSRDYCEPRWLVDSICGTPECS